MENAIRVKTLAAMDDMTGMYNRNKLLEVVNSDTYKDMQVAIIYWDINRLKYVNDTFGHLSGDFLIVKIAESIRQVCGEQAETFRYGGDEFIILMRNVTTKEAVRTKAEQLMAETKKMVFDEMDGKGITISVGIALAPEHGKTYMNLYRSADQALYETKRNGRNGFTIYGENRDITENR